MDRAYCAWFPELAAARKHLMLAVNEHYGSRILELFNSLDTYAPWSPDTLLEGLEDRQLKSVLLDLIAVKDTGESHAVILDYLRRATIANDKVCALVALNRSSAPERLDILEQTYAKWQSCITGYANYLRVIAGGNRPDVFEQIERERARPTFQITQPTWCRALFLTMANNNEMIWNERGINWIADLVIELAPLNYTNSARMLNTFQHVRKMKPGLQTLVTAALERVVAKVSDATCTAVHRQARAYLNV
jgi:aminopeptidase N